MYLLAKEGFIVIASDYRFHGALSRRDQWGGTDVYDVLSLVPIVQSFDIVDPNRLFMIGVARGGTMTYLALKRGVPVNAAAVIAGPSDLEALGKIRPEFVNGDSTYDGWKNVWADYAHRSAEHYRERSLIYWASRVNVPVLLMHAKDDPVRSSTACGCGIAGGRRALRRAALPQRQPSTSASSRGAKPEDR
jgi:dipeptidyl aminopeptidase/acylaminoacyl peptidase